MTACGGSAGLPVRRGRQGRGDPRSRGHLDPGPDGHLDPQPGLARQARRDQQPGWDRCAVTERDPQPGRCRRDECRRALAGDHHPQRASDRTAREHLEAPVRRDPQPHAHLARPDPKAHDPGGRDACDRLPSGQYLGRPRHLGCPGQGDQCPGWPGVRDEPQRGRGLERSGVRDEPQRGRCLERSGVRDQPQPGRGLERSSRPGPGSATGPGPGAILRPGPGSAAGPGPGAILGPGPGSGAGPVPVAAAARAPGPARDRRGPRPAVLLPERGASRPGRSTAQPAAPSCTTTVGEDDVAMATERPTTAPVIAAATAQPAPRLVMTSRTPGLAECSCSSTCVHLNRRCVAGCLF